MTWTKLGQEFTDEASTLSDAAFRTHVEALCWSNRRGLDLTIPAGEVKRFAETADPDAAIRELLVAGWWEPAAGGWFIGTRFADWQLEHAVVEHRRELNAVRQRRHRLHAVGDHSLCSDRCPDSGVTRDEMRDEMRDPVRNGSVRNGSEHVVPKEKTLSSRKSETQGPRANFGRATEPDKPPRRAWCAEHAEFADDCRRCRPSEHGGDSTITYLRS